MKYKDLSPNVKSDSMGPPAPTALSKPNSTSVEPSRDEIAKRAYSLYLDQGCPEGQDVQHWLQAEAQVIKASKAGRGSVLM